MKKIAIIGLGYVGLPLARLFATRYPVVGFDIKTQRVQALKQGFDTTKEVDNALLKEVLVEENPFNLNKKGLFLSDDLQSIEQANIYIVTVPTPVDKNNRPDLFPLKSATESVAKVLKKGDIVIYESTVYPGCTEEFCVPILQNISTLKYNEEFFVGYSPERINPGDKIHTLENILKITSGSTPSVAQEIDALYNSVLLKGTHLAPTIKVAEAAKVIENTQRDVNIAFVNELAKIFSILGIDTQEVLKAAGTKWNFLKFTPGLVGGHCTGVDPFYLAQKAQEVGYHPEMILAGRRINDSMGAYIAGEVVKLLIGNNININGAEVLVLGITFKENCPDVRNTKVVDVVKSLAEFHTKVSVYDPWALKEEVFLEHQIEIISSIEGKKYDAIVLAVAHNEFLTLDFQALKKPNAIIYDVKGVLGEVADKKL